MIRPGDRVTLINGLYAQWLHSVYSTKQSVLAEMRGSQQWDGYRKLKDECEHIALELDYFDLGFRHGVSSHWSDSELTVKGIQQDWAIVFSNNERRSVPVHCLGVIERVRSVKELAA